MRPFADPLTPRGCCFSVWSPCKSRRPSFDTGFPYCMPVTYAEQEPWRLGPPPTRQTPPPPAGRTVFDQTFI